MIKKLHEHFASICTYRTYAMILPSYTPEKKRTIALNLRPRQGLKIIRMEEIKIG